MSAHLIRIVLSVPEGWNLSVLLRLGPVEDLLVLFRVFELFGHDGVGDGGCSLRVLNGISVGLTSLIDE
jgi:hypothetical protein